MTQALQGQPRWGNHCPKSLMGNFKKKKIFFQFNAPPHFAQMTLRPRIKPSNHMPATPALILIPLYHYLSLATMVAWLCHKQQHRKEFHQVSHFIGLRIQYRAIHLLPRWFLFSLVFTWLKNYHHHQMAEHLLHCPLRFCEHWSFKRPIFTKFNSMPYIQNHLLCIQV